MKNHDRLGRVALLMIGAVYIFLPLILSGCSKKDEPPAASTGYYNGPMQPKNAKAGGKAGMTQ